MTPDAGDDLSDAITRYADREADRQSALRELGRLTKDYLGYEREAADLASLADDEPTKRYPAAFFAALETNDYLGEGER